MTRPIYLDNAATTRLDPRVLEAMLPYLTDRFGNPASRTHAYGWEAEEAVEQARRQVASVIGAEASELVWTSGATESNHLALRGIVSAYRSKGRHVIISSIEHSAVLETAERLEEEGASVSRIAVDEEGRIDLAALEAAIEPATVLVSVMHGNNEIGVLQDIGAIGAICRRHGVLFHTDATQSFGRVPIDVRSMQVDLLSASGHKIYGPKGVGALFVRRRDPRVVLRAEQRGGGQERGLRAGTLNVPAIVGFGAAATLLSEVESERIARLRDRLEAGLLARVPGARRNGGNAPRLPGISNLTVGGIEGEALILSLKGVAVSAGSACASASLEPSHVLLALGLPESDARASLRMSLGRFNSEEEIDQVIEELASGVDRLRSASGG